MAESTLEKPAGIIVVGANNDLERAQTAVKIMGKYAERYASGRTRIYQFDSQTYHETFDFDRGNERLRNVLKLLTSRQGIRRRGSSIIVLAETRARLTKRQELKPLMMADIPRPYQSELELDCNPALDLDLVKTIASNRRQDGVELRINQGYTSRDWNHWYAVALSKVKS